MSEIPKSADTNGAPVTSKRTRRSILPPASSIATALIEARKAAEVRREDLRQELLALNELLGDTIDPPAARKPGVVRSVKPRKRGIAAKAKTKSGPRGPRSEGLPMKVLAQLKSGGPGNASDIAGHVGVDTIKISGVLGQLKKRNLVVASGKRPHLEWRAV
jgi:hypothetical protein